MAAVQRIVRLGHAARNAHGLKTRQPLPAVTIVTTNTGGAMKYQGLIRIASDATTFLESIEQALQEDSSELLVKRKNEAQRNSWDHRVLEVESIFRKHLAAREKR